MTQPTVGAPAAVQYTRWGAVTYTTGLTVLKVTPTGRVCLKHHAGQEYWFNRHGAEEAAGSFTPGGTLRLDVEAVEAEVALIKLRRAAVNAVNAVSSTLPPVDHAWADKASLTTRLADLTALLAAAASAAVDLL